MFSCEFSEIFKDTFFTWHLRTTASEHSKWNSSFLSYGAASFNFQKQPPRGVPRKRCSENMQQIYRRIPLLKCDFNKVAKLLFFVTRRTWFTPSLLFSNSQGYSYSLFIKLQQLNFSQIYSVLLNITVFDQRYLFYKISLTFVFTQLLQLWNIINLFT